MKESSLDDEGKEIYLNDQIVIRLALLLFSLALLQSTSSEAAAAVWKCWILILQFLQSTLSVGHGSVSILH